MLEMKVVDRAEKLLDEAVDVDAAVDRLVAEAPIVEKVEWFDRVAGKYLVHQLDYQRRKKKPT